MEKLMEKMKVGKYPEYKDSEIEWVEEIPSHWEVKKFKRVFYEIKKRSNPELNCGSISFGKVVYKDDEKIPESTKRSYQVVQRGDFLVNPLNLNYDLISLRIALSDIDVVVSSGYIVLSNSVKLDKTYYKYFLHRFDVAFMKLLGSGVRQTLNWNDIANCDLIFPPLPEQTAIANFLDRKTALIDQAIDIKQKQIELLKERRQILIQKAVTRGLNSDVKMKDSGVEWIGEVPEHWEVIKLKRVTTKITDGEHISPIFTDSGMPFLSAKDVREGFIEFPNNKFVTVKDGKKFRLRCNPEKEDVLLVSRGATIGRVAIVSSDKEFCLLGSVILLKPNSKIKSDYLFRSMENKLLQENLLNTSHFSAQQAIYLVNLSEVRIAIPSLSEQTEIVKSIKSIEFKIATAISLKEQEIEKLKEYKATLINSAVTGKIKVV